MATRHYLDYGVQTAASMIISDCICHGQSSGWCGGEEFDAVEKICNSHNVYYVDDFRGVWKKK